jgi:hypothetical protein
MQMLAWICWEIAISPDTPAEKSPTFPSRVIFAKFVISSED